MSEPVRLAVTGAAGRMGREVLDAATDRDDVDVVLAVNRSPVEEISGVPVRDAAEIDELLEVEMPDVLVDFTGPDSSADYVAACADAGVAAVVGTTGFDEAGRAALESAAESVPVLKAANFSRGVAALRRAVREAVAALPGYDIEVTETHHNGKRDAPSGTANTILDDIEEVRGEAERVHGRVGDQPREDGEIGVHARRAGDVTGEHEVLLAGNHELLSLTHRAGARGVFAAGALDAAVWVAGRDAGRYDFDDVLDQR
ncbi:4-hydroxy-tetrahydrodipicolinate reductase [Halopelagius longus]|uniref:4-hydroxy-tetrahydrodipicolinate reductase n=1 Tax=Halopelagius longus TaxID=1236180 RepID=A0A1H1C3P6_9EURY|nr:4-hydroxy-tetrahydrodipicolinate reductase [Halopelagius longus]RDI71034.1 4-hydroxy-tetrahydrodipicolinate reductase [Halopelagius longus]SDQ58306.1 dihydrodipicolinate reductase [Halopelagius longus]